MALSNVSELVKLRYSLSGKLDVVKGALSERLCLSESFVGKSKTLKSYGALVSMLYYPNSEAERIFPYPKQNGAVPFERATDGPRLKVIEWAILKVILKQALMMRGTYMSCLRGLSWRTAIVVT